MTRFFRSEPGVVRIESDGSATLFAGAGESWAVDAQTILSDEGSPEISELEFHRALRAMDEAAAKFEERYGVKPLPIHGPGLKAAIYKLRAAMLRRDREDDPRD